MGRACSADFAMYSSMRGSVEGMSVIGSGGRGPRLLGLLEVAHLVAREDDEAGVQVVARAGVEGGGDLHLPQREAVRGLRQGDHLRLQAVELRQQVVSRE